MVKEQKNNINYYKIAAEVETRLQTVWNGFNNDGTPEIMLTVNPENALHYWTIVMDEVLADNSHVEINADFSPLASRDNFFRIHIWLSHGRLYDWYRDLDNTVIDKIVSKTSPIFKTALIKRGEYNILLTVTCPCSDDGSCPSVASALAELLDTAHALGQRWMKTQLTKAQKRQKLLYTQKAKKILLKEVKL